MRRIWMAAALVPLGMACSDDPTPAQTGGPEFAGVSWVAPDRMGRLVVGWKPAPGVASYRVYASLIEGRTLKNAPIAAVAMPDASTLVVAPTTAGARHYLTVRAVNAAGIEDQNTVERSAVATPDTTAPQFAGPKAASQFANAGATVTWDPATDDASPPEAIAYDVFAGRTAQSLVPVGRTARGETSLSVATLGTPGEPFVFTVRARDLADNLSTSTALVSGPLGADTVAPTFAGCGAVAEVGGRSLTLSWSPATDDHSDASEITYEVYAATAPGAHDFTAAPRAKAKGAGSVVVAALDPGVRYHFVCRARDAAGNVDANKAETTVTMATDVTPPTFGGLTTAMVDGVARTVDFAWTAASDDTIAPAAIVYDVYETRTPGVYDFAAQPRASSPPGATSLRLTNLEPRATLNWVVRARDAAFNRDANVTERGGDIKTSYAVNVLPILVQDCAVVGCHVSGVAPAGLNLAPSFAYAALVGVTSSQSATKKRVTPGDTAQSYLFEKITSTMPFRGAQMPAPQTGNALTALEKDIITSWILEGAPQN